MSETITLITQAQQGDRTATERLVTENTGLIWSIARRYFGRGVEPDDLFQLGCVGFLKAVEGFDTAYGTQFSTYAVPKIAGEIRRFLRDDGTIKVSRSLKERAALIRTARQRLTGTLGREPTLAELSEATALQPEDIAVAETATCATESLQRRSGEDGFALNTPDAGLYDDGEALYFVQDDQSLLQNGSEGYLTFGADGRYTSGSAELDEGIWQLLQDSTPDTGADSAARLEAVFDYIRDNFKYLSMAHYDAGTTDWAQEAAEAFLQQRKGNCYCFAATFMYCARRLGYQAYVVAGHESRPDNDHA